LSMALDPQPAATPDPSAEASPLPHESDAIWRGILTGDETLSRQLRWQRRVFNAMPSNPRCKLCYAPFGAPFGPVVELMGFGKWDKNPNLCSPCMRKMEKGLGGAEIELSFLFADLRESTQLAAGMSPAAYSQLLNGFYGIAASAVQAPGGTVDKYLGDGIMALFIPGFAGKQHAAKAVEAARTILRETADASHLPAAMGPLPIGIGVHTGTAYVGVIGAAADLLDFTALGDAVNLTQRLSSAAQAREILLSDATATAAGVATDGLQRRALELKGISGSVGAWSLRDA
jgi:adenylate cyclase